MNSADVKIVEATSADIDGIVSCHLESFEGFFLSFMGPRFLGLLYRELLRSPKGIGLVALRGKLVVGFALGTMDTPGLYRNLIVRRLPKFFIFSLINFLKKPSIALRLFRALFASKKAIEFSYKSNDYLAAGLFILNNLKGSFYDDVEQWNIGVNYDAGSPASLYAAIDIAFHKIKTNNSEIKTNIGRYIDSKLDRRRIYEPFIDFISEAQKRNGEVDVCKR